MNIMKMCSALALAGLAICNSAAIAQSSYCDTLDQEQAEINSLYTDLNRVYPVTMSVLKSCMREAKNSNDVGGCMVTAEGMAACSYSDWQDKCGYSSMDFTARLATIAARRSTLIGHRQRSGGCVARVPDDTNE